MSGIWFNKRCLARLKIEFPHKLTGEGNGWRLEVGSAGQLGARYSDGGEENFDVDAGDSIVATGEEVYIRFASNENGG